MQGLDVGAVVHYTGQYEDDNASLTGSQSPTCLLSHKRRELILQLVLSARAESAGVDYAGPDRIYTFNLPPPAPAEVPGFAKDGGKNMKMKDGKEKNVMPVSTAEYNPCGWRAWLNNTTITLGMQNVLDLRSAVCGRRLRERLRRIACHDQRPVLVRPAKEEILRNGPQSLGLIALISVL